LLILVGIVVVGVVASAAAVAARRSVVAPAAVGAYFVALSGCYVLLGFGFVAALLLVVCGIGVPLLFASGVEGTAERSSTFVRERVGAGVVVCTVAIALVGFVGAWTSGPGGDSRVGSTEIASELLTTLAIPFGAVGLVVVAALVGIVSASRRSSGALDGR
jgi:NADH:ubiquinone oxidoreductase subunit 6 (subunit J)